mgnify:CR=1 FL=1
MPRVEEWPEAAAWLPQLRARLKPGRLRHVLGVAEWLDEIARTLGLPRTAARHAALLHDYCRNLDGAALLAAAAAHGLHIDAHAQAKPVLLHGPVAAAQLAADGHLKDEDVLDAIRWHTTGRPALAPLGQALYVADFSEPNRKYPEAAATRDRFRRHGLEHALRYATAQKHAFSQKKGNPVHPQAEAFYHWVHAYDGHLHA